MPELSPDDPASILPDGPPVDSTDEDPTEDPEVEGFNFMALPMIVVPVINSASPVLPPLRGKDPAQKLDEKGTYPPRPL